MFRKRLYAAFMAAALAVISISSSVWAESTEMSMGMESIEETEKSEFVEDETVYSEEESSGESENAVIDEDMNADADMNVDVNANAGELEVETNTITSSVTMLSGDVSGNGNAGSSGELGIVPLMEGAYYTSIEEVSEIVREALKNREQTLSIKYASQDGDWKNVIDQVLYSGMDHTGVPDEGDYLLYQYAGSKCDTTRFFQDEMYYYTQEYTIKYYDTAEQNAQVDAVVKDIIASLDLEGKSDEEKVLAIYRYVEQNVCYDDAAYVAFCNKKIEGYENAWSAYGALVLNKCLCQGYCEAIYRLLLEAGVDNRIVAGYLGAPGVIGEANHAWNIVRIGDVYYYVDVTRDASLYRRHVNSGNTEPYEEFYFLKGDESGFVTGDIYGVAHTPMPFANRDYGTAAFYAAYPIAEENHSMTSGENPGGNQNDNPGENPGGNGNEDPNANPNVTPEEGMVPEQGGSQVAVESYTNVDQVIMLADTVAANDQVNTVHAAETGDTTPIVPYAVALAMSMLCLAMSFGDFVKKRLQ